MRWWKVLGLAGAAGVAATGVVIVQAERKRRAYTPEQVREQLHARLAERADQPPSAPALGNGAATPRISVPLLAIREQVGRVRRLLAGRRKQ
ncbi:hypothetical protein [Nocardia sp. alder85J]|uniref:hypothetical protein n=1 Tax=Nocardia sp. alder85J TaxID=2862949 RepID=UPI001CD5B373|nr:hypothetical protein [Nocardia sp. alder85J]MCX4091816.1 hypothetical protein [Nocardia sp. alder85J]